VLAHGSQDTILCQATEPTPWVRTSNPSRRRCSPIQR